MKKLLKVLFLLVLLFNLGVLASCGDDDVTPNAPTKEKYTFLAPSGTPSLALSTLFDGNELVEYEIVAGSNPLIAGFTSKEYDFIVAPVNVGAKLFANKPNYKLVKTIVWGNFYIASLSEITSVNDLEGKTITAFSQNSSPDIMLQAVLDAYGLKGKVNVEYVDSVQTANSMLMSGQAEITITAEPSASVLRNKKTLYTIDLQQEWSKLSGGKSFPQAGLFVNVDLLEYEGIDEFIEEVITRIEDYKTPSVLAESAVKIDDAFKNVGVEALTKAIPNCWISIKSKEEQQAAIKYYAEKLVALGLGTQIGGGAPSEDFYY
jgi:NitT/TauT family transport system substrate-binding protein